VWCETEGGRDTNDDQLDTHIANEYKSYVNPSIQFEDDGGTSNQVAHWTLDPDDKNNQFVVTLPQRNNADVTPETEEEIAAIESLHPMEGTQMAMARDLFLFQVYTGLAYSDAEAFDIADYKKVNGKWVNVGNRIKTGVPYVSQLMPQVVEILERYGMQTPKVNNVQYNASLKVIQRALGIKTRLHSHLGRHTFGTRMQALGAKLENVQRMMGHRDIRMTQRYAKVLAESVRDDFAMVEEKLKVNKTLTKVNGGGGKSL
jgi:integrase